jgi:hypothetical protein
MGIDEQRTERIQPVPVTKREKEGLDWLVRQRARELAGVARIFGTDVIRGLLRDALVARGFDPDAPLGSPPVGPADEQRNNKPAAKASKAPARKAAKRMTAGKGARR